MTRHLYETLGLQQGATKEEIKKAYRRAALQTHPDRLPQGPTEKDKRDSEEKFRRVNNAYEVLSDDEKRKLYDHCGEWPPPEAQQMPSSRRSSRTSSRDNAFNQPFPGFPFQNDPFSNNPFFSDPFFASGSRSMHHQNFFGFTDPFTLSERVFEDVFRDVHDPFVDRHRSASHGPFIQGPFGGQSLMGPGSAFGMFPSMFNQAALPFGGGMSSFQSSSGGNSGDGGRWVSQSQMTRTINGVTESVFKRTDSNGNEYVTYSYPDGRERTLVNGVEQPSQNHALPAPPQPRSERALPPPPYPGPPSSSNRDRRDSTRRDRREREVIDLTSQDAREASPVEHRRPTDKGRENEYYRRHHSGSIHSSHHSRDYGDGRHPDYDEQHKKH